MLSTYSVKDTLMSLSIDPGEVKATKEGDQDKMSQVIDHRWGISILISIFINIISEMQKNVDPVPKLFFQAALFLPYFASY